MLCHHLRPPQLRCDRDVCQPSLCPEAQAGGPCQTQYQFTMSMELQTRMDPSWRKSRSYSSMANTWRKHTLQLPTSDGRPSSLGIHGLPITIWKLTGLARVSPCLDALLSVKGSQMEAWWRMTD